MNDEIEYNIDNDNANKKWEVGGEEITGTVVERIHTNDLQELTKPDCQHVKTTRRPSDEFENYDEVICEDCPLGWFFLRTEN